MYYEKPATNFVPAKGIGSKILNSFRLHSIYFSSPTHEYKQNANEGIQPSATYEEESPILGSEGNGRKVR